MAYTTIDDPSQHFDILTRSGVYDSSGTYDLTGLNFKPDFVWEKVRSVSGDHYLQNSSLTGKKMLKSNSSAAENTDGNIESYLSNGIQINRQYDWNSSRTLVDWFWKANGGTTSSNTDGSITTTVQANTTAGFSIVTYTGNATDNATIGHGLGATPEWVMIKNRASSIDWAIGHKSIFGNNAENLRFTTGAAASAGDAAGSHFSRNAPSSTVITLGDGGDGDFSTDTNRAETHVAYCFTSIKGYSKFGSYKGNITSGDDGTFVYTGFKPAWIMVKSSSNSGQEWVIFDNKRDTFNQMDAWLYANANTAEDSTGDARDVDFLSNGFKFRNAGGPTSYSGRTYIYMAFAEHPFVSSKGVPVTAR